MPLTGLNPIPAMVSILEKIRQLEEEEIERFGKTLSSGPKLYPYGALCPCQRGA